MRVSREAMAEHRKEIVAAAARLLRERGIAGTSVADLMQAAGLTHGGFYRHFESKDALVAEAIASAFHDLLSTVEAGAGKEGASAAVEKYLRLYLSDRHVANPGYGCPLAALGVEAAREGKLQRKALAEGAEETLDLIAASLKGTPKERRVQALGIMAQMLGTVVIARAVGEGDLSREILDAARTALLPAGRSRAK